MKRQRRRFTPEFKAKVVLEILTGTQSPAEACRSMCNICPLNRVVWF